MPFGNSERERYYGPVHRVRLGVTATCDGITFKPLAVSDLTLSITTHAYPFAASAYRDTSQARMLVEQATRILSPDRAIQEAETLRMLNAELTHLISKPEYPAAMDWARKTAKSDPLDTHPLTMAAVAQHIVRHKHQQNHASAEAVLLAADAAQRIVLRRMFRTLDLPNAGIDVSVSSDEVTPTLRVAGPGLSTAIAKLAVNKVIINAGEADDLLNDLALWQAKMRPIRLQLKDFTRNQLQPVTKSLRAVRTEYREEVRRRAARQALAAPAPGPGQPA
jgi:hypothetical protein